MPLRDLHEVIMPTTRFILRVKQECKDRHMVTLLTDEHVHEIRQEVEERLRQFEAASLDAQSGQAAIQDMNHMIRLSEDFVLLVALDQKWSKEIRHKCTCSAFFKDAQTEHAAAAALSMFLFPAEVSVPADSDIRVVNQRRRLKRITKLPNFVMSDNFGVCPQNSLVLSDNFGVCR